MKRVLTFTISNMKMRLVLQGSIVSLMCTWLNHTVAMAQDRLEVHGKADFVSSYIWRGIDQNHGFAVQPSLTLGYKGFTVGAWGSTPLSNFSDPNNAREFDLSISYTIKGLTLSVTDYWWGGQSGRYGYYNQPDDNSYIDGHHHFEGTAAYYFGDKVPLTLSFSTWFAGADAKTYKSNKRAYSSYFNASYNITLPADITLTPSIGFSPWESYYSHNSRVKEAKQDRAVLTDICLKAAKTLKVNDNFTIPVFIQAVASPAYDHSSIIAGFSLGF